MFPSLNDVIAIRSSRNKSAWNEAKRKCEKAVADAVGGLRALNKLDKRRYTVVFTWYEWNMERDPDNIGGGGEKPILDALKELGLIEDDGWAWIESVTHRYRIAESQEKVGVLVEFWTDLRLAKEITCPKGRARSVESRILKTPAQKRKIRAAKKAQMFPPKKVSDR
jgi:Holliday junction resolvase RusA-like endonuclease